MTNFRLATALVAAASIGCADDDFLEPLPPTGAASLDTIDFTEGADDIVIIPDSVDGRVTALFHRYSALVAPNGKRVHFLAQEGVPSDVLLRTRGIVADMLADRPGTTFGADKSDVFNRLARNERTFAIYTDESTFNTNFASVRAFSSLFGARLFTLDSSLVVREGSPAYLAADPDIDGTIGSAARFVYLGGIDRHVPDFVDALRTAREDAVARNDFRPHEDVPPAAVDDEYLTLGLEVYYGLWAHDPTTLGFAGSDSEYDYVDRAGMQAGDPALFTLIEDWFVPTHDYIAYLDPTFLGTFEMALDPATLYTHRSQYLRRAGARSLSTAAIRGNELDNEFFGSQLGTDFEGRGGNDVIEGSVGVDRATYTGTAADYIVIEIEPGAFRVQDMTVDRDGVDGVRGIETLVFGDGTTMDL